MLKKIIRQAFYILLLTGPVTGLFTARLHAQAVESTVTGKVVDPTGQPVAFARVVFPEARRKATTDENGNFSVSVPAGETLLRVVSPGLKPLDRRINVPLAGPLTLTMQSSVVKSRGYTIRDEREGQSISRLSLDRQALKDSPATFGDSLNALTTLPGVIRTGGFFGPLTIRGAAESANRYYIDDIPILNPQHFGAIQSIISNELIERIDLYASAFPAEYSNGTGAVIDIETRDAFAKSENVIGASFISADFFTAHPYGEANRGYFLASGRVSYLTAIIPLITRAIDAGPEQLPQYYDYQLKGKYYLDDQARHSLTALFFGSYDTFIFLRDELTDEELAERRKEGADPLGDKFGADNDVHSHAAGFYYKYEPSKKLGLKTSLYSSLNWIRFKIDAISATEQGLNRDINVNNNPFVFGLRQSLFYTPADWYRLNANVMAEQYRFTVTGQAQQLTRPNYAGGQPDLGDSSLFKIVPLDQSFDNTVVGGYVENVFTFGGFEVVPAVRTDYLALTGENTINPRGRVSYTFESDTKVGFAGGQYSSFGQTNFFLFNQPFNQQPQIAGDEIITSEYAIHRSVSIEQKFDWVYTFKVEGFLNDTYEVIESQPLENTNFANSGRQRARGFEVLLRKDRLEGIDGLNGWMSYTYTDSQFRAGSETNPDAGKVYPFQYEQPHSFKLAVAYNWGVNQLGARFELNSGFPYTPVVGSAQYIPGRYSQVYGSPFSERYETSHRLDIRYSRTSNVWGGRLNWYIEIINVYNFKAANSQSWKYNQPYKKGVNPELAAGGGFGLLPNFGLEFRF